MEHDLVVFVPGFLGSRLTRDGRDLWGEAGDALLRSRPSPAALADLALPPGLGDEPPEERFRVVADELTTAPDSMPGLLSSMGHPDIRTALGDPVEDQFVPFAYDWRLSHRLVAERLKTRVERELTRWSERVGAHFPDRPDAPKVVLVCHSTGGLAGRYYLECLGGRETARTLVTLGTPQQGFAGAVRLLTGHAAGDGPDARALNGVLRGFALTLPSVAQMLPVYAAVRVTGKSRLRGLDDRRYPVPGLPTALVEDALSFDRRFHAAREAHRRTDPGGRLPYDVHCLGSTAHPTPHTVGLSSDGLDLAGGSDGLGPGDGTVPRESAVAHWALRDPADMLWTDARHADMASAAAVGERLSALRKGLPASGMLAGDERITLHAPSEAVAGRPFEASVLGVNLAERRPSAVMRRIGSRTGENVVLTRDATGRFRAELRGGPGKWLVEARVERPHGADRKIVTLYTA
ncbi:lipase family alpha/beta hydrolase [Streptomyces sp. NPDC000348]|uniref:lipase family alpha/beta hydrolase n=1 Tax=Streptomyces sp. NPDC000348 TaxID=3364538 RepID=UPI0036CFBCC8